MAGVAVILVLVKITEAMLVVYTSPTRRSRTTGTTPCSHIHTPHFLVLLPRPGLILKSSLHGFRFCGALNFIALGVALMPIIRT